MTFGLTSSEGDSPAPTRARESGPIVLAGLPGEGPGGTERPPSEPPPPQGAVDEPVAQSDWVYQERRLLSEDCRVGSPPRGDGRPSTLPGPLVREGVVSETRLGGDYSGTTSLTSDEVGPLTPTRVRGLGRFVPAGRTREGPVGTEHPLSESPLPQGAVDGPVARLVRATSESQLRTEDCREGSSPRGDSQPSTPPVSGVSETGTVSVPRTWPGGAHHAGVQQWGVDFWSQQPTG